MSKKNQLIISFIILFSCISAIVYSIDFRSNEKARNSYKEVNTIIQEGENIENIDVYNTFLKNFDCQGDKYYYSFIELAGFDYLILLLTNGVYKDEQERDITICTDIYYPLNNVVTRLGNICSGGTAYPIAANITGIYTAAGHEVAKYNVDFQNQNLKLLHKYIMFFHKVGEKINTITIGIIDDKNKIVSEKEFDKAYKEYENANTIYFKRLC